MATWALPEDVTSILRSPASYHAGSFILPRDVSEASPNTHWGCRTLYIVLLLPITQGSMHYYELVRVKMTEWKEVKELAQGHKERVKIQTFVCEVPKLILQPL